jgi:hypothetical protein
MHQLPFEGRKVLLVEDEPLILLEIESRLRAAGADTLGASNLQRGLEFAEREDLSCAVLDFQLRNENSRSDLLETCGPADPFPLSYRAVLQCVPAVAYRAGDPQVTDREPHWRSRRNLEIVQSELPALPHPAQSSR